MSTTSTERLHRGGFAGVFLISLSTLMLEILITRLFSVTLWYHFAFVAVSIAMLGLSAGAILVYLLPKIFSEERAAFHLTLFSTLFAAGIALSLLVHVHMRLPAAEMNTLRAITFAVISIPFALSGVVICIALTKFPAQVSRLYAADLCGAASGCILIVLLLDAIGDIFSVMAIIGGLCGLAAVFFALNTSSRAAMNAAVLCALAFFALAGHMIFRFASGQPMVQVDWAKGNQEAKPLLERWNSYSRIKISGNPQSRGLLLTIDGAAATALMRFDELPKQRILANDVSPAVHELRPDASVAIIGVGGGRDMLIAHNFGQKRVLGIEMNEDIVEALTGRFGDFTGHLERLPGFRIVNDEARSYLSRSNERFDIIMANMIDTWAATAAGAFALSENSLYTVEAWRTFLQRLTPRGLISFTRWCFEPPGEMYRLVALAAAALKAEGVADPRRHIAILTGEKAIAAVRGTIVVARNPLTEGDLDKLDELDAADGYKLVHSPRRSLDPLYGEVAAAGGSSNVSDRLAIDVSAPTDDRPFFFNMLRPRDLFAARAVEKAGHATLKPNLEAVTVLGTLSIAMAVMVLLFIVLPLILTARKVRFAGSWPLFVFFGAIGLAFLLVEVSQLQRLSIFLGHPTYGLSVVLFSLLLSSGVGSYSTAGIREDAPLQPSLIRMGFLLAAVGAFSMLTPPVLQALRGATMPVRIAAAVSLLFPMGFFMGMAFPIGMKFALRCCPPLTPWLWGINGVTSVFASVIAVAISLAEGIGATFWVGAACYAAAAASLLFIGQRRDA